jgi:subtilisin family serine protease
MDGNVLSLVFALLTLQVVPTSSFADMVVVRFEPTKAKREYVREWAWRHQARVERELRLFGAYVVATSGPLSHFLAAAKRDAAVRYAAPLRHFAPCATVPNDPLFAQQWQFLNTTYAGADIQATQAWDVTTGSQDIVLAVVDSGLQFTHPDFTNRLWTNPGEIPGNGIDDDNNGFVDDVHGWNFYAGSPDISPTLGHGTSVASQVGAATNNGVGVAGVNWNSPLMILNIFSPSGWATDADAADAIVYACDNGARVINASWGGPGYSPLLADVVAYAQSKGVLLCVAAGNYNFDSDEHPFYPAALGSDALLAVGGTTQSDGWVYNYGAARVHLSAPASMVYLARYPSTYGFGSGTSYAAPLVTGGAGLVLARHPDLDVASLRMRLISAAARLATLQGRNVAEGRLDLAAAVQAPSNPPPPPPSLQVPHVGASGVYLDVDSSAASSFSPLFCQVKLATSPIGPDNYSAAAEQELRRVPSSGQLSYYLDQLEPSTTYWIAARHYTQGGVASAITTTSVSTPAARRIFFDSCDTTSPVWLAQGFTLAGGSTHTGALAWQDSPDGNYTTGTVAWLRGGPFDISSLVRTRLTFYLEYFFPSRNAEGDRLEVRASGDGGMTWKILRKFRATSSPSRRFTVPLDEFGPTPTLWVEFRFISDENSYVDDGVYLDDIAIEEGAGDLPFTNDIIVEVVDFFGQQTEQPTLLLSGAWTLETLKSTAAKLEGTASFSAPAQSTAMAHFTPFFPASGLYEVFVTHSSVANATAAVRIAHAQGDTVVSLVQTPSTANRWISLGTYRFLYGREPSSGRVTIDASNALPGTGKVAADAVRFVLLSPDPATAGAKDWLHFE